MDEPSLAPLDLEGLLPSPRVGPGRQAAPLVAELVRELNQADLSMPATVTQESPPIKKIRDSHHAVARMLALGTKEFEVAAVTGYSASRISVLKADPQFQELVEFYRREDKDLVVDFRKRMISLGIDALQEIADRLNDTPEEFTPTALRELVRDMADRTGHGPAQTVKNETSINVTLVDRMAKSRERIKALMESREPLVINHDPS